MACSFYLFLCGSFFISTVCIPFETIYEQIKTPAFKEENKKYKNSFEEYAKNPYEKKIKEIHKNGYTVKSWTKNSLKNQKRDALENLKNDLNLTTNDHEKIKKEIKDLKSIQKTDLTLTWHMPSNPLFQFAAAEKNKIENIIHELCVLNNIKHPVKITTLQKRFFSFVFPDTSYVESFILSDGSVEHCITLGNEIFNGNMKERKSILSHEIIHLNNFDVLQSEIIGKISKKSITPIRETQFSHFVELRADQIPASRSLAESKLLAEPFEKTLKKLAVNLDIDDFNYKRLKCVKLLIRLHQAEKKVLLKKSIKEEQRRIFSINNHF